jgi:renalase
MDIAIIGAGLAGLAAARSLADAGTKPVLFEKSRGLGGRVATRRVERGALDHGAPLLHRLPPDAVAAAGAHVAPWRDGIVGVPGNSSLPRALAAGLDVRGGVRVVGLERPAGRWRLRLDDGGAADGFAAVLVAIPQPQALALLGSWAGGLAGVRDVRMRPGLTLLAWLAERPGGPAWRELAPPLKLAVRDGAKPGRDARGAPEGWVVHAADAEAEARREDDPEAVARDLIAAFRAQTGAGPAAAISWHRWRYARVAQPLGRSHLWDPGLGLGLAGDWCLGDAAGDAVASGRALAEAVRAAPPRAGRKSDP